MGFKEGHYIRIYWHSKKASNKKGQFYIVLDKNGGNIMKFIRDVIKPDDNNNIVYEPIGMNYIDTYGDKHSERKVIYDIDEISEYSKNEKYNVYCVHYDIENCEDSNDCFYVVTKSIENAVDYYGKYISENNKDNKNYRLININLEENDTVYIADVLEDDTEYSLSFPSYGDFTVYISRSEKFSNYNIYEIDSGVYGCAYIYNIIAKDMKDAISIYCNFYNISSSNINNIHLKGSANNEFARI
jgi:hypothetical protein